MDDIIYLLSHYWESFLQGLAGTIVISILGTFIGLCLGTLLAFGKNMKVRKKSSLAGKITARVVSFCCSAYSLILRGTPMMVQAIIFKYGCQSLGLNWTYILIDQPVFNGWFFAGTIVISLNTGAYMCEIVRSGLNGIDHGEIDGARSLGMSRAQANLRIALPTALRNQIPTIGNEWIVNIKDSSVLNVISVTELYLATDEIANSSYRLMASYIILAAIYLILTLLTSLILRIVERKMDRKPVFTWPAFHFREKKGAQ
ncbi:MAG: amino acid ABC transporter permease [Bacillota bacterium]|nr:amino acid ABC transporter permease [Bacillota bacterium]